MRTGRQALVRVVGRGSRQQVVVLDTVQDVGGVNRGEGSERRGGEESYRDQVRRVD